MGQFAGDQRSASAETHIVCKPLQLAYIALDTHADGHYTCSAMLRDGLLRRVGRGKYVVA